MHVTAVEALGVTTVSEILQDIHQSAIEWATRNGIIYGLAVRLSCTRDVIVRLSTTFNLQRIYAHSGKAMHMLNSAQIFRVHDVGTMLILKGRHVVTRAGLL